MKRKTKRGGACSVFGTRKKGVDTIKLKQLFNELPPQLSKQIEVLLKKDPNIINEKLKGLKLEEVEEQHKKEEDELTTEITTEVLPEKKVEKYIEVRRKQLSENTNQMVYSEQEKNILLEELDKLNKIFNLKSSANAKPASAKPASANAKPASVNAKANVIAKPANATAKANVIASANVTMTKSSENAKANIVKNSSTGQPIPLTNVARLISQNVKQPRSTESRST